MTRHLAPAKINLALVVGSLRPDGKHEVATVLQHVELGDRIALTASEALSVDGFPADTLVRRALEALARAVGVEPCWSAEITKAIPVAAGLGGGSSDAATALRLANELLPDPLEPDRIESLAATLGADVPFFLRNGPQLGTGVGADLAPLELPQDFWVVLVLPDGVTKPATAEVYRQFDERRGADGFEDRRAEVLETLATIRLPRDLARLPRNDLASSPLADRLLGAGAFRADVSGAGPCVYGLFDERRVAEAAAREFRAVGRTWTTQPLRRH